MAVLARIAILVTLVAAGGGALLLRRSLERRTAGRGRGESATVVATRDVEQRPEPPEIDLVDEAGYESFPASDPPAHSHSPSR